MFVFSVFTRYLKLPERLCVRHILLYYVAHNIFVLIDAKAVVIVVVYQ